MRHPSICVAGSLLAWIAAASPSTAAVGRWEPLAVPGGGTEIVVVAPSEPSVLYAAGFDSLFRSDDYGQSWARIDPQENPYFVLEVTVSPRDARSVYVLTTTQRETALRHSADGGLTWDLLTNSAPIGANSPVRIDPINPSLLYLSIEGTLVRSLDGGHTFEPRGEGLPPEQDLRDLEIDPSAPARMWLLAAGNPDTVDLYRSTDAGASWSLRRAGLPDILLDVAQLPGNSHAAITTDSYNIFRTADDGASWVQVNRTPLPDRIVQLAVAANAPATWYARGLTRVLKSEDAGATWQALRTVDAPLGARGFALDPRLGRRLYAATHGGGVLRSSDGGRSWRRPGRFTAPELAGLVADPSRPGALFAATRYQPTVPISPYNDLFRSRDGGRSWTGLKAGAGAALGTVTGALAQAVAPPFPLYAGIENGVAASFDAGGSWQARRSLCGAPAQLQVAPSDPATLYASVASPSAGCGATPYCPLVRSFDGGGSWQCIDFEPLAIDPHRSDVLYRKQDRIPLEKSTDGGTTWTGLPAVGPNSLVTGFAIDANDSNHLLVSTSTELRQSLDGGATWSLLPALPPGSGFHGIRLDPRAPGRIYLRRDQYNSNFTSFTSSLWTSTDGGATWLELAQGLPSGGWITGAPVLDPRESGIVYLGLSRRDLYRFTHAQPETCQANAETLCLSGGRFRVRAFWQDFQGNRGMGHAVGLTADTGAFWFFSPANLELAAKVVDGTDLNSAFWFFEGALTNVEHTVEVTDTSTGEVRTYFNPAGRFASAGDTSAFPAENLAATGEALHPRPRAADGAGSTACGDGGLCLAGRYRVEVSWRDFTGGSGTGQPIPLTHDTGAFWFFDAQNLELFTKVVDGTSLNGHTWFFYASLTNVEFTLTVTDTATGARRTYTNPPRTFASVGDTAAF